MEVHILYFYDKTERNGTLEKDKIYMFVYCANASQCTEMKSCDVLSLQHLPYVHPAYMWAPN
jgi:hypothetical protein